MNTKQIKIAIEQAQKVCNEMSECSNKFILQDSINDMNKALNIDIVIWRCTKDLFMDSGEQVFTNGNTYPKVKSNSEYVTIDDEGYTYCFDNWQEHFIAI